MVMDAKWQLLYLNQRDVIQLGGGDMRLAIRDIERVFLLKEENDVRLPHKVSMGFGETVEDEKTKGRINAMPGYLGGEYNMAGIKWIGSNPGNISKGLPRASAITILNDPDTKFPIAVMDGTIISCVRTGAASGVIVKYLAKKNSRNMLVVGAGLQSQAQIEAVSITCPTIENIYVYDIVKERAQNCASKMQKKLRCNVMPVDNAKNCAQNVDIIITATGAARPFLDADWIERGSLYINVGGYECTYDTVSKADKIFVDDWEGIKHRKASAISRMAAEGLISDDSITASIGEVIKGEKKGRESDTEIIYTNCVGMGIEDIAIATRVYRRALQSNSGKWLEYWK
jgi:2,3-diaminopropionate biosynthesis protein SbnB